MNKLFIPIFSLLIFGSCEKKDETPDTFTTTTINLPITSWLVFQLLKTQNISLFLKQVWEMIIQFGIKKTYLQL